MEELIHHLRGNCPVAYECLDNSTFSVYFFFIWHEIILENGFNLFPFTPVKAKSDQNAENPVSHRNKLCIQEKWNLLLPLTLSLAFMTKFSYKEIEYGIYY